MGIQASYSGSDGQSKAFDFDVASNASRLAEFLGPQPSVPDEQRASQRRPGVDEAGKVALKAGDQPEYLDKQLDPAGSIEAGLNGLRLKGDNDSGGGRGLLNRIYSIVNGIRRWWTLRDIDPPVPGKIVGPSFGTNVLDADSSSVDTNDDAPFSFLALSRMANEIDDTCSLETLYAFLREVQVSAGKRVIGLGPEQRQFIGNFLLADSSRIAVRPIVRSGGIDGGYILLALQFGPEHVLKRQMRDRHFPAGVGEGAEDLPEGATFTVRTNTCPNYTFGYAKDSVDGA